MKYKISANKIMSKSEIQRTLIKWLLYSLCLLVFYMIMRSGAFGSWQPFPIIALAVAVSMRERELSSCIFALFCGYFIDISCRFIFGFSAVWLMVACVAASLLSRNLIRVNLLNFMWISALAVLLEFSMDYLFNVLIWNIRGGENILTLTTIPSAVSTVLTAPFVYLLVRYIDGKCSENNKFSFYSPDSSADDEELKSKD